MSSYPTHGSPFDDFDGPRGSNILGIVGFVLSLLCVTAPLGLLVSLIALYKAPRGFAVAGVIIGMIFSAVLGAGLWGTRWLVGWGPSVAAFGRMQIDHAVLGQQLDRFNVETGRWPTALSEVNLPPDTALDPWGNPYQFAPGEHWRITTSGPDGLFGSEDDFELARGEDMESKTKGNAQGEKLLRLWRPDNSGIEAAWAAWESLINEGKALEEWQHANQGMSAVAGRGLLPPETAPVDAAPADPSTPPVESESSTDGTETP